MCLSGAAMEPSMLSEEHDTSSARMQHYYERATSDEQHAIDRVFICLCGWGLSTLLYGEEATEDYNPYFDEDGRPV